MSSSVSVVCLEYFKSFSVFLVMHFGVKWVWVYISGLPGTSCVNSAEDLAFGLTCRDAVRIADYMFTLSGSHCGYCYYFTCLESRSFLAYSSLFHSGELLYFLELHFHLGA